MGRYISNTNTNFYQDNEVLLLRQGIAKNHKEFLIAGTDTWTIDHDVIVRVRVWGGGGGGGACNMAPTKLTSKIPGSGGGAGGAAEAILKLNAGTYSITIGAGGVHSSSGNGGNGGASSFHTYITCSGGLGGLLGRAHPMLGGAGGTASFDLSGFGGFLYMDSRFGGAGGPVKTEIAVPSNIDETNATISYRISSGGGGAGESGGPVGYAWPNSGTFTSTSYMGGGGGGYNPPFIYVTNASVGLNSGRGVGTGGCGGYYTDGGNGYDGQPGAVVIEWN